MSKLKRLAAPKGWKIERKTRKFVVSPNPGPHARSSCIPLAVVLRDMLGAACNMREVRKILNAGSVMVDGHLVREYRFPVGPMDILSVSGHSYIVVPRKNGLEVVPIDSPGTKMFRIKKKNVVKSGKLQLTFHDGRTMLVDSPGYRVGDSVVVNLKEMKVEKKFPMEKGAEVVVAGLTSEVGKIKEIIKTRSSQPNRIVVSFKGKTSPSGDSPVSSPSGDSPVSSPSGDSPVSSPSGDSNGLSPTETSPEANLSLDVQVPQGRVFVVGDYLKSIGVDK